MYPVFVVDQLFPSELVIILLLLETATKSANWGDQHTPDQLLLVIVEDVQFIPSELHVITPALQAPTKSSNSGDQHIP